MQYTGDIPQKDDLIVLTEEEYNTEKGKLEREVIGTSNEEKIANLEMDFASLLLEIAGGNV